MDSFHNGVQKQLSGTQIRSTHKRGRSSGSGAMTRFSSSDKKRSQALFSSMFSPHKHNLTNKGSLISPDKNPYAQEAAEILATGGSEGIDKDV